MPITVYNRTVESHRDSPYNYPIFRPSILGNPYTHLPLSKTKAIYKVANVEEALRNYERYFDIMYSGNLEFRRVVDEIYENYRKGEEVYLECYCKPSPCHGDIIKRKLQERLVREKCSLLLRKAQ